MGGYSPYQPFGPHGPAGSPTSVTPNPTAASPSMNIGGGNAGSWPTYGVPNAGGGGGGGVYTGAGFNPILRIIGAIFTFFALLVITIPLACLYPFTAVAASLVAIAARPFLHQLTGGDADGIRVCTLAVVLIVAYIAIRIEYRLAQKPVVRKVRHGVRLLLFAIIAVPTLLFFTNLDTSFTYTVFVLNVLAKPSIILRWLASPMNDAVVLACLAGIHLLLWKAERPRDFWHRRLRSVGLK